MIRRILIHNSPTFKDIELFLDSGFNVFSGASGSGKSVFMDSLLAILGIKESNADLIEANIIVDSATFDFLANGVPQEDGNEIVLSILKKEKTRYFLNHASSSKKRLNDIVCGFAKHISTKSGDELSEANLLKILDIFIAKQDKGFIKLLDAFMADFHTLQAQKKALEEIKKQEADIANLKAFATFEIQKIEAINPKEGEYEELLALKKMISKQEKIKEQIDKVRQVLESSHVFEEFLSLIDTPCVGLMEGLSEFEALVEKQEELLGEIEGQDSEKMLDKIAALAELNRRFGGIKEALAYLEEQKIKLKSYENIAHDSKELESSIKSLEEACEKNAKHLHEIRQKHLNAFGADINSLCAKLKLQDCHLSLESSIMHTKGICKLNLKLGKSEVAVLSSGEYNRLRLAIMCIDAHLEPKSGILVLDEVDANLSGEESAGVAQILKSLSSNYQIFAISHQTHMPILATNHYLVQKGKDKSTITKLDINGRIQEIARMISGANITNEALEFAKKQLQHLKN